MRGAGHVAIQNPGYRGVPDLSGFHDRAAIEQLDLDIAVRHRMDVFDPLAGHLARQGLLGEVRLDAKGGGLRRGGQRHASGERRCRRRDIGH